MIDCGDIINEICVERERQDRLWGAEFDDLNTANDWVAYIVHYVAEGAYDGKKEKYTPERFREHLIKTATICVAAIETIDRNKSCADRHYDKGEQNESKS